VSINQARKPRPPSGLQTHGKELWRSITTQVADNGLVRDAKELHFLALSCSEADLVAVLKKGLEGQPLLVRGCQGQDVAHPLIAEIRQHRMAGASLLARIKMDDPSADVGAGTGVHGRPPLTPVVLPCRAGMATPGGSADGTVTVGRPALRPWPI
jgi:hypothetical protein